MRRFRKGLALILFAGLCLGQTASIMTNKDVRRVGMRLACLCGVCKNSVGDCQMMGCSYAGGARQRIAEAQAAVVSDDDIVAQFVTTGGLKALVVPPASGFNLTAWLMPIFALLAGLYAIFLYIRHFRRPAAVPVPKVAARYSDMAEKDLAKLE